MICFVEVRIELFACVSCFLIVPPVRFLAHIHTSFAWQNSPCLQNLLVSQLLPAVSHFVSQSFGVSTYSPTKA